jgi:hypothetical protein
MLDEMQDEIVSAWRDWNSIGEMPPALGLIELRVVSGRRLLARC